MCGDDYDKKTRVSSANKLMFDSMSLTISLMYIGNKRRPIIEPCGRPALISDSDEAAPGITTR